MRRIVVAVGLASALLAGCSTGVGGGCDAIADEGLVLLQEFIDEVDGMTAEELAGAVRDDSFLGDLETRADELDAQAGSAGCSEEDMARLLSERASTLSAETELGQTYVDLIIQDEFFGNE